MANLGGHNPLSCHLKKHKKIYVLTFNINIVTINIVTLQNTAGLYPPMGCTHHTSYYIIIVLTTKVKQVKSFVVYWISSQCRENFCGFCFIFIKSAAIAQSIRRENFHNLLENHKTFLSCSFVAYGIYQFKG